jgi:hypothetical protein
MVVGPAWTTLVLDEPPVNQRNAAEVQLLWELRQALRRHSLYYAVGSLGFGAIVIISATCSHLP